MITGTPKRMNGIRFTLGSPTETRKMSATKIITADTYNDDGFPIDMGLMDTRLGVIEPGLKCKTCGKKVDECPGHFGHIDLAMPVVHVGYTKQIKALLRATCNRCHRILLPLQKINEVKAELKGFKNSGKDSSDMQIIWDKTSKGAAVSAICPHCGEEQEKVDLEKPTTFRIGNHKLTPKEVREWLEGIPHGDLIPLGWDPRAARPESTILTVLPVPPVTVRPSITLDTGERSEDDLTHKLVDILRINRRLQENRDAGAPQLIIEDLWDLLQYHCTTYFDNQTSGIPPARHRSGRPLKTLAQRLKGKEGRFRSNLSGKRVNFSARTVISPDPFLSLNQVGVPIHCSRELTVPVRVTRFNIVDMKEILLKRPNPDMNDVAGYEPCVNYIIRPDGRRVKITEKNAEEWSEKLEIGFKVERQLMDGDIVLFNRQPSLHRMSMMAHEVKIMPGKTFRFNLSACPPYNADFDGDEMNLHVLQGEEARGEARILIRVQEHILSPRFGGPVMGGIHDHISGLFLLTYQGRQFTRETAYRIISRLGRFEELPEPVAVEKGVEYWTGKQLFSLIIPADLNMEYKASICEMCTVCKKEKCEYDAFVVVRDGQLITGTVDGKSVSAFKGNMLSKIIRDYGLNRARQFIDDLGHIAIGAITNIGFSTGIDDEDIPEDAKREIEARLGQAESEVDKIVEEYNMGHLEPLPGRTVKETLEVRIMGFLGKARDSAGKIAGKHLGMNNSAVIMARSGARGSMLNLSQMAGTIGQQAVRGERIQRGYAYRTLPHFKQGDLGADSRGFVKSSYKSGLSPTEYFFHSMGGREGLVDTAVRTSRSGYMQRRLINALEDLKVDYDGTVRNTSGDIVQFIYGEDGIDPTRSIGSKSLDIKTIIEEVRRDE